MRNYKKENAEIGARIQEIRAKRNMTQEVLAEKAGICNAQQMSSIERGLAGLSISRLKGICKALDIESDYLLFGFTHEKSETILHKYIDKMTSKQLYNLTEIVRLYAQTCGIEDM